MHQSQKLEHLNWQTSRTPAATKRNWLHWLDTVKHTFTQINKITKTSKLTDW